MVTKSKPVTPKKTVLIVEDSQAQLLAMASWIESLGLKAICASNGVEGFFLARKHTPDLAILDVFLPDMSGIQICYILKQDPKTSQIPIVVLTAHPRKDLREESLETAGAVEFVPKDNFTEMVLSQLLVKLNLIEELKPEDRRERRD